jgi:DNA-directed RNA polymerase II subunit RPB1
VVKNSQIFYDPDPKNTVVAEDQTLVDFWNDTHIEEDEGNSRASKWLMRFVLDFEKVNFKNLEMGFIEERFHQNFENQFQIMYSDTNSSDKLVFRLRMNDLQDEDEDDSELTTCMFLKENMDKILSEMTLKGFPEITKVSFSKYKETEYNPATGTENVTNDNWMIETDGVALQKVMGCSEDVNYKRTSSNDIQEILRVLGIEAVRLSLINELRFVLGSYGIYVNYRHLSTLCDVMTQRGILTSITRHGINRVDTGPLRKCSFEETVEILYEAAVFAETDTLSGITENIIMG